VQTLSQRIANAPGLPRPDRPVPVALVITDLDVGGAERMMVALARGLDRRRWEPSVIALGTEGNLVEPLRAAGIDTECLDVDRRRPIQAVLRLAGALRKRRPRLVQSFLFHANVAARLAAGLAGGPWVVSGIRVAEHRQRWHLLLDRWTVGLALGSVCVSEGVLRFSRDVARINPARLTVIANGVDTQAHDEARPVPRALLGVPAGAHLVLFVGRLDEQKGVDVLLDAAERVAAERADWHLALVGDGPERAALHDRTARSPALAERVHWLGRRDDVPALLKAADLLVLPSLWEGMPNVVLEAMAARRAVVATAVEGSDELVIPGRTGWLVPPSDADALTQALLEAASDTAARSRLGEAARARVEADYSLQRVVQAYDALWSSILGFEACPAPVDTPERPCAGLPAH
jgi:starch synthase (maltosyl-transferring)